MKREVRNFSLLSIFFQTVKYGLDSELEREDTLVEVVTQTFTGTLKKCRLTFLVSYFWKSQGLVT